MAPQGESKPFIRNIFTLNTCAHIVGSQVLSFQDESEMLLAWAKFVNQADPDVIIAIERFSSVLGSNINLLSLEAFIKLHSLYLHSLIY